MVRYRKLRLLFFTVIASLATAVLVGLLFFAAYKVQR